MFDPTAASDQELRDSYLDTERQRRALDAHTARVSAELERRGTCDTEHGLVTGSWLAARTDLPSGECRYRVKISAKLVAHLPVLLAALDAGRISWQHVQVVYEAANPRIIDLIARLQEALIDSARGLTFRQWRNQVIRVARQLDVDGGYNPSRDHPDRVHLSVGIDGQLHLSGTLSPELGLGLKTELDRLAAEQLRKATRDKQQCPLLAVPGAAERNAHALADMARRSAARDLHESAPPRTEVIVTIRTGPDGHCQASTADGTPVAPDLLAKLCPDALWRRMWLDPDGVPLDLGRSQRLITPHQRVALTIRDGGCTFPGCDAPPAWCDAHHVDEWDLDLGPTDLVNLGLLCRHHHGVTHRNGWTMHRASPDGTHFTWTTPFGGTIHSQRHGRQRQPQPLLGASSLR